MFRDNKIVVWKINPRPRWHFALLLEISANQKLLG
jgi:hypothetical protein